MKISKTKLLRLTLIFVVQIYSLITITNLNAQYIGSVTCFNDKERAGGNMYPYNQSLFLSETGEDEWWENLVEEIYHSGIDFSALLCRGYSPGRPSIDMGDPRKIPNMMAAMDRRGLSNDFKLAIFDDCPAGWTANHNYDQGRGHNTETLFDCRDTANYKYIWDYNLKISIENIPDERRFKIDGRMVIIFWSVKPRWMKNIDFGSLKRILAHIRTECQKEFGFNPFLVVQDCWFDNDSHLRTEDVDGVHNWFSSANKITWTLHSRGDLPQIGVTNPGIRYEGQPDVTFSDPRHGQTLIEGLEGTIKSGALITLCEGFTDAAETAAYWRSKDTTYYDYPNQRIDILRRYSQNAFLDMRMIQAEGCDFFNDSTPGNSGGAFRAGDIDIIKTDDALGGWAVCNAEAGEWLEWVELPIPQSGQIEIRYAAEHQAQIQFVIGDQEGEVMTLDSTGSNNKWAFARMAPFNFTERNHRKVRLKIISGVLNLNYFNIMHEGCKGKVAISNPDKDNRYLFTDTVQFKAEAIGFADSIVYFELLVDTACVASFDGPVIDTFLTDLPLGEYFLKAKATDLNGNVALDSCLVFVGEHAYTINDSIVGEGAITFDPPGGTYVEGTQVSVTASTTFPSYFNGWLGDTVSFENPLVLTMDKDYTLIADFDASDNQSIRINFQPDDSQVPEGYLKDIGLEYGERESGFTYGWAGGSNMHTRDRGTPDDIRYATLNHMQKSEFDTWEFKLLNGKYMVYLVMGDPSFTDQINTVTIEDTLFVDDKHIEKFDEFRTEVEVTDNKLTIAPGEGAENAKICFVEISQVESYQTGSISYTSDAFELNQNYPNPFQNSTEISFSISGEGYVKLSVYNSNGQLVSILVEENRPAGDYQVQFNSVGLTSGIYYYHLQWNEQSVVKRMLLLK